MKRTAFLSAPSYQRRLWQDEIYWFLVGSFTSKTTVTGWNGPLSCPLLHIKDDWDRMKWIAFSSAPPYQRRLRQDEMDCFFIRSSISKTTVTGWNGPLSCPLLHIKDDWTDEMDRFLIRSSISKTTVTGWNGSLSFPLLHIKDDCDRMKWIAFFSAPSYQRRLRQDEMDRFLIRSFISKTTETGWNGSLSHPLLHIKDDCDRMKWTAFLSAPLYQRRLWQDEKDRFLVRSFISKTTVTGWNGLLSCPLLFIKDDCDRMKRIAFLSAPSYQRRLWQDEVDRFLVRSSIPGSTPPSSPCSWCSFKYTVFVNCIVEKSEEITGVCYESFNNAALILLGDIIKNKQKKTCWRTA